MSIKIIADSGCDLTDKMKKEMNIELAPLILQLGNKTFIDDDTLDIEHYIEEMAECEVAPKTSCPSPDEFMKKYSGDEGVFVVTLSNFISGSYNSAVLAKNMFLEEMGSKFIHVFDSLSASAGETIVAMKINELAKLNFSNMEIVEKVTAYIKEMKTYFLLENLGNLSKSGRLSPLIVKVASILSIKPIMAGDNGVIKLSEKVRGYKKAFKRLVDIIGEDGKNLEDKVLGIAYCNCLDRALEFKKEVLKKYNFKDIVIVEMGGVISSYADNGGILIAF